MPRSTLRPRRQAGTRGCISEPLLWMERRPRSAVLPQMQATTTGLAAPSPASSELRGKEVILARDSQSGSFWPALAQRASQLAPSSSPHPLPLHPPRAPSSQGNLRPQALAASNISPRPTASAGKTQGGPQPLVSHHRGRCLGRKAEVRKCPAPRRLPFREKERRSRSLRQHFRAGPSRAGPGRENREMFRSPG